MHAPYSAALLRSSFVSRTPHPTTARLTYATWWLSPAYVCNIATYTHTHTHAHRYSCMLVSWQWQRPQYAQLRYPELRPQLLTKLFLWFVLRFFFFFSQACECGCVRVPTTGASHHAASSAASQSIGLFTCCRVLLHLHVRHGARTVRRDAKQGATMLARQLQLLQKLCLLGHYRLLRSLCSELLPYNICVYVTTTALAKSAIASREFSQSLL